MHREEILGRLRNPGYCDYCGVYSLFDTYDFSMNIFDTASDINAFGKFLVGYTPPKRFLPFSGSLDTSGHKLIDKTPYWFKLPSKYYCYICFVLLHLTRI